MFSCGRDSVVMLDLFMRFARDAVSSVVFMWYAPGMSYEESVLTYYERRYGIEIARMPHPDVASMRQNADGSRKYIRMSETEKYIREMYGAEWTAWGYRKTESLQRRGQLAHLEDGVDWKYRKVFPIGDWSPRHVENYVRKLRLVLPPEYKVGFRDLNGFKGKPLVYIHNTYPEDYKKIIALYPDVEGELMKAMDEQAGSV